jgi:hypothetical protein
MVTMEEQSSQKRGVKRFWVGWTSRHESIETPFPKWKVRATRVGRAEPGSTHRFSYAAVVDAEDRESAWQEIARRFPDSEEQFVREKSNDFWPPADRYPQPQVS